MKRAWIIAGLLGSLLAPIMGCDTSEPVVETEILAAPRLLRLTATQTRASLRDLFGPDIALPVGLELDIADDGLFAVGAGVSRVSSRGVEQYYDAALSVAQQLVATPEGAQALRACTPTGIDDAECLRTTLKPWVLKIWRRPATEVELDILVALGIQAGAALNDVDAALSWPFAAILQSPNFVYRTELGEPDPKRGADARRLTAWELAARLSYFLTGSTPDSALLAAAESGALHTTVGRTAEVDRLLASPAARTGVIDFFAQWLRHDKLEDLNKDPTVFPYFAAGFGVSAREETERLIAHLVFDEEADYRDLFTTRTTFVNPRLAALYKVAAPTTDGFGMIELPDDGVRAGLLGHASFLASHSHVESSSATLRGVAVRETLLCQLISPPPAGLNTAIPEAGPGALTLRERLEIHMTEPSCSGCHLFTDPIGFALEPFDGLGGYRTLDNGGVIDPSGFMDGYEYEGPRQLGVVLSQHPDLVPCLVNRVYAFGVGHSPEASESDQIEGLTAEFQTGGRRVKALFRSIALSDGFGRVGEVE